MPRWRIRPASRSAANAANCSAIESGLQDAEVHDVELVEAELADVLLDLTAQLRRHGVGEPVAARIAARADLRHDHEIVGIRRERDPWAASGT